MTKKRYLLREVLDLMHAVSIVPSETKGDAHITVSSMLSSRDGPRTFPINPFPHVIRQVLPDIRPFGLRWRGYGRTRFIAHLFDQSGLALIPDLQELMRGRRADYSWVGYPRETHAGDMA